MCHISYGIHLIVFVDCLEVFFTVCWHVKEIFSYGFPFLLSDLGGILLVFYLLLDGLVLC